MSEEMAGKGDILCANGKDGPQVIAKGDHRWNDDDEKVFLDTLAATCNVRRSAGAAGFSTAAVYWRRRHHADFARRWQSALEQGYAHLEMQLVRRANEAVGGYDVDPEAIVIEPMTAKEAIQVLQLHCAAATGAGSRWPGWRARPRSLDEVRQSILTKLEAIEEARREAE